MNTDARVNSPTGAGPIGQFGGDGQAEVMEAGLGEEDVAVVLEEYLEAVKAGRRPQRDEYLRRCGSRALELADCLDGLRFVLTAAPELAEPFPGPTGPALQGGEPLGSRAVVGDFRIVREVGRGGMGVVYEAEQLSLGRRVALKVLPLAAALDPRQRERFQLEAQTAAQLHHPHIVPVFGVGCDRDVHFFAMQFIEGRSLAAVVREYRRLGELDALPAGLWGQEPSEAPPPASPSAPSIAEPPASSHPSSRSSSRRRWYFRAVARVGMQAAEALEHAHALGVIHRDVKPGNLLLDARGDLWVTDFGLARFRDDPGLTRTGDLLGTLAYMSPEQAAGRRDVDHRSDIYSLGATLYELLLRRPPFEGHSREEILRKVAHEEPPRPRRLDPAVPRDLETIVLKAMDKERSGRYATAQELADDLGRFLEDRPIRARPAGPAEQLARWARRHRAAVGTAAAVLVAAMGVGTALMARERQKTEEARRDLKASLVSMFRLADTVTYEAMGLAGYAQSGPSGARMTTDIYQKAEDFYATAARQPQTDDEMRSLVAHANNRLGFTRMIMRNSAGEDTLWLAVRQYESLIADRPAVAEYRTGLAETLENWAMLTGLTPRAAEAEPMRRRALELREEAVRTGPVKAVDLVPLVRASINRTSALQKKGRGGEAEAARAHLHELLASLAARPPAGSDAPADLAAALVEQSRSAEGAGQSDAAETLLRAALVLAPEQPEVLNDLAWALASRPGRPARDLTEACEMARKAVEKQPSKGDFWNTLGVACYRAGDREAAEHALRRSMSLRAGGDPYDWLALALCRLDDGDASAARPWYEKSQEWSSKNREFARDPALQALLREVSTRIDGPAPATKPDPAPKPDRGPQPAFPREFDTTPPRHPGSGSGVRDIFEQPLRIIA